MTNRWERKTKMVDTMDMEDIIREILEKNPYFASGVMANHVVEFYLTKIIREITDFVEAQKHVACVNCKGYKFKNLKSACQVM